MSDELTPSQIVEWLEEQALHLDSRHDGGDTDPEGWTYQAAMCRMIAERLSGASRLADWLEATAREQAWRMELDDEGCANLEQAIMVLRASVER